MSESYENQLARVKHMTSSSRTGLSPGSIAAINAVLAKMDTMRAALDAANKALDGMDYSGDDLGVRCPWCHIEINLDADNHLDDCELVAARKAIAEALKP